MLLIVFLFKEPQLIMAFHIQSEFEHHNGKVIQLCFLRRENFEKFISNKHISK